VSVTVLESPCITIESEGISIPKCAMAIWPVNRKDNPNTRLKIDFFILLSPIVLISFAIIQLRHFQSSHSALNRFNRFYSSVRTRMLAENSTKKAKKVTPEIPDPPSWLIWFAVSDFDQCNFILHILE
jgi:hypothetical protein